VVRMLSLTALNLLLLLEGTITPARVLSFLALRKVVGVCLLSCFHRSLLCQKLTVPFLNTCMHYNNLLSRLP
jgi:hypothetical protein